MEDQNETQEQPIHWFDLLDERTRKHIQVTLSSGTAIFQYARKTSGPQDRTEPQEDWPYAYCAFQIHYMEETIA